MTRLNHYSFCCCQYVAPGGPGHRITHVNVPNTLPLIVTKSLNLSLSIRKLVSRFWASVGISIPFIAVMDG